MDRSGERKSVFIKLSAIILLMIFLCILPGKILFFRLCTKQDHTIPLDSELIVSSCKGPHAAGVPGGEFIFVHEELTGQKYLLNLTTKVKTKVPKYPFLHNDGIFLTSELVWLKGSLGSRYESNYVVDLTTGKRFELTDLSAWANQPAPPDYVPYFQSAGQIFIHHGYNRAIALLYDFRKNPESGVILYENQQDMENGELVEAIIEDLGLKYTNIDYSLLYADIRSPTGRYVARRDGIYLSETDIAVIIPEDGLYRFAGWYHDESGVVYKGSGDCYMFLLESCLFSIPGNVLKLNLPAP